MKAIVVTGHGGPEVLELSDVEEPTAGAHEILVDVEAAGVNFIDTYQRAGIYDMALPYTPGLEGAGVVRAVGPEVTSVSPGDTVAWCGQLGSYAELITLPADKAVVVPEGITAETSRSHHVAGPYCSLFDHQRVSGETGRCGARPRRCRWRGVIALSDDYRAGRNRIGTVSTESKEAAARQAGAAHIIRYDHEDVAPRVREILSGSGVNVVYDGVGKDTFEASLDSLEVRGTLALFGQASGAVAPFDPQILNNKGSLVLTRPSLTHFTQTHSELSWRASEVLGALASGQLHLTLSGIYPLAEAAQAHIDIQARKTSGKLLLSMK